MHCLHRRVAEIAEMGFFDLSRVVPGANQKSMASEVVR